MHHFQRLNVAFSRGQYALYFLYNRILIDYNIFVGPPLLIALMEFAKSNRLVHAMLEPLAESFPDLPTLNHDIQKANKSYEACHSSPKSESTSFCRLSRTLMHRCRSRTLYYPGVPSVLKICTTYLAGFIIENVVNNEESWFGCNRCSLEDVTR
ncbi:unnamed protein product [Penicillium camemberti]|uniref:Str. FM013 n=1 Tax=Penicillium camemberti (strain FM 013) TaxID=1429867 RepID=A0A0G4NYH4_PENC3|nr:unnamed protein product [Penicillium camemberti]